jgi:hypothetical protein
LPVHYMHSNRGFSSKKVWPHCQCFKVQATLSNQISTPTKFLIFFPSKLQLYEHARTLCAAFRSISYFFNYNCRYTFLYFFLQNLEEEMLQFIEISKMETCFTFIYIFLKLHLKFISNKFRSCFVSLGR